MSLQKPSSPGIIQLLYGLIIASVIFGFYKQLKTAAASVSQMTVVRQEEPGSKARVLRNVFYMNRKIGFKDTGIIAYKSGRKMIPGQRDPEEFFFDAQYGFIPEILDRRSGTQADYFLLDSKDENEGLRFCRDLRLSVVAVECGLILGKKEGVS